MSEGFMLTQGIDLFVLNTLVTPNPAILKMACPTGISSLGAGTRSQINVTSLDTVGDEEFITGLGTPGQISVPFHLKPAEAMHQGILTTLKESGQVFEWVVGFSDGTAAPTVNNKKLVLPTARTTAKFRAYIAEVTIDVATNDRVNGTMTLQRSGQVTWNFKPAA